MQDAGSDEAEELNNENYEYDQMQEGPSLQFEKQDTGNIVLNPDFDSLVKKIRDTVKMFRKSPVKNDMLQKCIKADLNKAYNLILDTKTRWV